MQKLLYAVSTEFLRASGVAFLFYVTGILNAPNKEAAIALSITALFAAIAAGLRAVQVFIPILTWAVLIKDKAVAAWFDAFTRAFLSSFIITITAWLLAPDYTTWKSVLLAAIVGAAAAGARALQGLATPGESPGPGVGINDPNLVKPKKPIDES